MLAPSDKVDIPTNATVVSVVLRYDFRTVPNLDTTHVQFRQINSTPNTTAAADLWTDAGDGTIILESISEGVATNEVVNLGDFAVQDVQAKLAQANPVERSSFWLPILYFYRHPSSPFLCSPFKMGSPS